MQMGGGIKIARVLTGQWVLLAARTDAAVQHPCRCFEKEILCATQKPQGVLRSLRLLTVSLYHFYRGLSRVKKRDNHGWLPLPPGRRTYSTLNTEYQLTGVYSTALSVLIVYATFTEMSRTYDC